MWSITWPITWTWPITLSNLCTIWLTYHVLHHMVHLMAQLVHHMTHQLATTWPTMLSTTWPITWLNLSTNLCIIYDPPPRMMTITRPYSVVPQDDNLELRVNNRTHSKWMTQHSEEFWNDSNALRQCQKCNCFSTCSTDKRDQRACASIWFLIISYRAITE